MRLELQRDFWKRHYVVEQEADEIERNIRLASFSSNGRTHDLMYFEKDLNPHSILISQGTGGQSVPLGYICSRKSSKGWVYWDIERPII